ncbi:MAG TPA: YkgJ family cysteine cluster protein [Syntrophobacter fumaroxidans]|nr:YkgJ family cysteine cluster protein [Syntrophobacter fumaroxidans]
MVQTDPTPDQPVLKDDSPFRFVCRDTLPCFTQCCRDVNIYLTPYDILRLRRALRIGSTEFLGKHTRHFLARTVNIPVVQLRMDEDTLRCMFVSDAGCTVYENRPWACRMFPLDLASREGEYQLITGKDRCLGLLESSSSSVGEWLEGQGVAPYVEMERLFQTIVPSSFKRGAPMDAGLGRIMFLAYDLDRFVEIIRDERFKTFYDVDEDTLRRALSDDEELLRLAFRYIRSQLEELYPVT